MYFKVYTLAAINLAVISQAITIKEMLPHHEHENLAETGTEGIRDIMDALGVRDAAA